MSSSDVLQILKGWKREELEVFGFWASGPEKGRAASFGFEGKVSEVDGDAIRISGDPSTRVEGTSRVQAFFSLAGATPSAPDPRHLRFTFESGAVLDLILG